MVETTTPACGPEVWLEPVEINTRSLAASTFEPYPLDAPTCVIELEDGAASAAYRLRRPQRDNSRDEYRAYAEMFDRDGKQAADCWLWDQLVMEVQYPGASDWTPLTPELRRQISTAHKSQSIHAKYLCQVTVLPEKSEMSFSDGTWCLQLEIGPPRAPVGVVEFLLAERAYQTKLSEYQRTGESLAARLVAAQQVFDAAFQSCVGATVGDLSFTVARAPEFVRWTDPFFKLVIIEQWVAMLEAPVEVSAVYVVPV